MKLKAKEVRSHFFEYFTEKCPSSMPSYFISKSIGQSAMVFETSRDIFDVIFGEIIYSPDDDDKNEYGPSKYDDASGNGAELAAADEKSREKREKAK